MPGNDATRTDLAELLPAGLTDEEANFVYNVEVLGLPMRKAASMAGMPVSRAVKPHVVQAREVVKRELRGNLGFTKEDIVAGYQEAISMGRLVADPMAMLAGWKETAKILGLDAPARVDINLQASIEVQQASIRNLSTDELLKRLGAGDVIDVEFHDIGPQV